MLVSSLTALDPDVWSGRASQEVSPIWFSVLDQCIRPLIGAVHCSGPPWISARGRSLYRTGLDRAIWVTSVRSRREDRSPSRRYLSQTSAGKTLRASLLRHRRLLISSVPWFVLIAVPSSRPAPSTCDARMRGHTTRRIERVRVSIASHARRRLPSNRVDIRIVTFGACSRLHSRYGSPDCSAAQGDLCREAPTQPVTRPSRSPASGPNR